MKTVKHLPIALALSAFLFFALPSGFAQIKAGAFAEIFEKVKDSVILLEDGQNSAYGICLASSRNQKFMYVLSSNQLSIGVEKKIRGALSGEKSKQFKTEKLRSDAALNFAIFKIESPPKSVAPITRIPQDSLIKNAVVWALGPPTKPHELTSLQVVNIGAKQKFIELSGNVTNTFWGSPVFDSQGRVVGCITANKESNTPEQATLRDVFNAASISALLDYATNVLQGLDLYPIWKEIYPAQFTINRVKGSVALLDTKKSGAGIFLGWVKKSKKDTLGIGYVLTASHVVFEERLPFSVQFTEKYEGKILGETMKETIDEELDLAIVKIENCPPIKPVTFIRTDDLETLERVFAPQPVATIGYAASVDWRYKFGRLTKIAGKSVETNLPLETGDSGGPIFNDKGEVLALNLETIELRSRRENSLSVSRSSRTLLKYLEDKLSKIDFEKKWGFYEYPSFWSKNRIWLVSSGAAAGGGIAAFLLKRDSKTSPPEPFSGHPEFP